jgi:hypothetical protein
MSNMSRLATDAKLTREAQSAPTTPIGAEARGKRRALKSELARLYAGVDRAYRRQDLARLATQVASASDIKRAFARYELAKLLGDGAHFEMVLGQGTTLVWSVLKPRGSLAVDPAHPRDAQECVVVEYFIVGQLPGMIGKGMGFWSIAFKDHALGRLFERNRNCDGAAVLLDAHRAILKARVSDLADCFADPQKSFLLPAGKGVFVCTAHMGADVSNRDQPMMSVLAKTYLDEGILRDDQRPLAVDAAFGQNRVGDNFLLPIPLRRIEIKKIDDGRALAQVSTWGGMPEGAH